MARADPDSSCPCAPAARVRIYELAREWNVIHQLCKPCLELMKAKDWQVRMNRTPPFGDLRCDYCEKGIT